MGICAAKAARDVSTEAPTLNQKEMHWSKYAEAEKLTVRFPGEDAGDSKEENWRDEKRFWSWDRNADVSIRYADQGQASKATLEAMTIPQAFKQAVQRHGDAPALLQEALSGPTPKRKEDAPPSGPLDTWERRWTWSQYYDACRGVGKALMSKGLAPKDSVCIYGFNSAEWILAAMGCTLAGGCSAGIYPTDTPQQTLYKAKHSGAVVAFVESASKAAVFVENAAELPKLKAIVVWGGTADEVSVPEGTELEVFTWDSFVAEGAGVADADIEARMEEQKPGMACVYIYTSGTTGRPKAVMVTHDNIIYIARSVMMNLDGWGQDGQERIISYLPLSHVAGMMLDMVLPLSTTAFTQGFGTTCVARNYDLKIGSFGDRLRCIRPTAFLGVPRVWEKFQAAILMLSKANPLTGFKLKVKNWAKESAAYNYQSSQLGGTGAYPGNKCCCLGHDFFDKKVLSQIKMKLGLDCTKFCGTSAAPIQKSTLDFFGSIGIEILECYGMSESTGATTFSTPLAHRAGSVGWAVQGCEVKILAKGTNNECRRWDGHGPKTDYADAPQDTNPWDYHQGEICYRGRHIMAGYMANPELGAAHVAEIIAKNEGAIDENGWLRSGDKGVMDTHGMVMITGRYKELIIGAGGENVAPIPVEDDVKLRCPAISNIMMVGNKKPYCVALITLKNQGGNNEVPGTDELDEEALELGRAHNVSTISEAIQSPGFIKAVEDAIKETNRNPKAVPKPPSSIKRFTILPYNFSIENQEFTPTFKLKRGFVEGLYAAALEKIYAAPRGDSLFVDTSDVTGAQAAESKE